MSKYQQALDAFDEYRQIVESWNAQVDAYNQWDVLDDEAKIEWALAYARSGEAVCADQSMWCDYIAGLICTYLKDGSKQKAIAGIIERRLWNLPASSQPEQPVHSAFLVNLARSRQKYPGKHKMFDGLLGEIHELKRAYAGDGDIRAEAFDVAVCAYRIATEGDQGGNEKIEYIPNCMAWGSVLPAQTAQVKEADDSLLLCASDLEQSAVYDNLSDMQECVMSIASRIRGLAQPVQHTDIAPIVFTGIKLPDGTPGNKHIFKCPSGENAQVEQPAQEQSDGSADLRQAALIDLAYINGAKAGWNLCVDGDDEKFAALANGVVECVNVLKNTRPDGKAQPPATQVNAQDKQISALKTLVKTQEACLSVFETLKQKYTEAIQTLESERAANSKLTEELERATQINEQLLLALKMAKRHLHIHSQEYDLAIEAIAAAETAREQS